AGRAVERIRSGTAEAGLTLHPTKTRIVDATGASLDFLGYRFDRDKRFPRAKGLKKLKDTIRAQTKRTSGRGLQAIIAALNPTPRGWVASFKHSYPTTFTTRDGWVRMRLRSLLRRRQKKPGRGRGSDHQRWPNTFFAAQGLYSWVAAHASDRQPSRRSDHQPESRVRETRSHGSEGGGGGGGGGRTQSALPTPIWQARSASQRPRA